MNATVTVSKPFFNLFFSLDEMIYFASQKQKPTKNINHFNILDAKIQ